jgi:hypothetical protein
MYNVFGSGASHAIYAQFMAQLALANRGWKVCLIQDAGTRMALWFYAMMHLIRLQQPLNATIRQQKFLDLTLTNSAKGAVQDIKEDNFWKCMYILLRAVFPALRALQYCDSNTPCMDKLFHLPHRTTVAIENSLEHLNDESLFGSLKTDQNLIEEGNIVLGLDLDNSANNHEDEIVFHEPIPVTDGIDDELSDDGELTDDDPIQTPSNTTMSFGR